MYAAFLAGASRALARSAYVQSIPVREEYKCLSSGDLECLRTHGRMRVEVVAASARRALASPVPSGVSGELEAYVEWVDKLPPIAAPQ